MPFAAVHMSVNCCCVSISTTVAVTPASGDTPPSQVVSWTGVSPFTGAPPAPELEAVAPPAPEVEDGAAPPVPEVEVVAPAAVVEVEVVAAFELELAVSPLELEVAALLPPVPEAV